MPGTALGTSFININSVPNSITINVIIVHMELSTSYNVYITRSSHLNIEYVIYFSFTCLTKELAGRRNRASECDTVEKFENSKILLISVINNIVVIQ